MAYLSYFIYVFLGKWERPTKNLSTVVRAEPRIEPYNIPVRSFRSVDWTSILSQVHLQRSWVISVTNTALIIPTMSGLYGINSMSLLTGLLLMRTFSGPGCGHSVSEFFKIDEGKKSKSWGLLIPRFSCVFFYERRDVITSISLRWNTVSSYNAITEVANIFLRKLLAATQNERKPYTKINSVILQ
jgi:hypothetical protein